jgi:general secretion pathway protein I
VARTRHGARPPVGRSGGFTLLELLLAFMVFALSFATVLEILSGSMRNTVRARQFTEAALTAQSVMDQVGIEIPLEDGYTARGEDGAYRWSLEIYEYETEDGDTSSGFNSVELAELSQIVLLRVDLEVSWGDPPRDRTQRFSTIKSVLSGWLEARQ